METKRASELIAKQDRQLKANYLSRLLRGNAKEIETIEAGIREVNGITFLSDYFAVIQFFIEDYKGLFEGDRQLEEEQQIEIVRFAMKNVSEEMAEKQNNRGYMADMEDILTLIVSFAPENAENGMAQVKTLCEDIQMCIRDRVRVVQIDKNVVDVDSCQLEPADIILRHMDVIILLCCDMVFYGEYLLYVIVKHDICVDFFDFI